MNGTERRTVPEVILSPHQRVALELMGMKPVCRDCGHARTIGGLLIKGHLACVKTSQFRRPDTNACEHFSPRLTGQNPEPDQ